MGGSLSHEYQYLTDVGDNTLLKCVKCDFGANTEQSGEIDECPKCNNRSLEKIKGIEVRSPPIHPQSFTSNFIVVIIVI